MNYLIDVPSRNNGIYMILNIIEKKAYVGLAQNMLNRTRDHYLAICNKLINEDNEYLIKEENMNFLHIPIFQEKQQIDSLDLRNLESIYIMLMRDKYGFQLYNKAKRDITEASIKRNGYKHKDYVNCIESLASELEKRIEEYTGFEIDKISKKEKAERCCIWNAVKENFCPEKNKNRFCLKKSDSQKNYSQARNYCDVLKRFKSFYISKNILSYLDIKWTEKSIKDEDLNLDKLAIISNFGSHNGEIPYEILKKMDMDLKKSSDGCAYWALKNVNEINFREEIAKKLTNNEKTPIYILFKTTSYDNSGGEDVSKHLDSLMTQGEILQKDRIAIQENKSDLMHSYKNENDKWVSFPTGLTYITIPVYSIGEGTGYKAVAFRIKRFYLCKENVSFDKMKTLANCSSGQQGTYFTNIDASVIEEMIIEDNSEDVECLMAELEYPYIVEIGNTPNLRMYLSGKFDNEVKPRIVFHITKTGKKGIIKRAFAFQEEQDGNRVYVYDVEDRKKLEDVINDTDEDLFKEIKKYGKKGEYKIYDETRGDSLYEVIDIDCKMKDHIKIFLDRESEMKQPNAIGRHKYYCFEDNINSMYFAFRYDKFNKDKYGREEERKTDRPLFVLDPSPIQDVCKH